MALRWIGPVLAVLGLAIIAALALFPTVTESPLTRWILTETLAPARVFPLIGLGTAFALGNTRAFLLALALFGLGILIGLRGEYWLLWLLDTIPGASRHLFLSGPITYLAAGAALIASTRWRNSVMPLAAIISGAMLALTTRLTDPSLHEFAFTFVPVLAAFWIIVTVSLTLRAFQRGWFAIFARILGSWLLAIGILYGGASLVPPRATPPPAPPEPPATPSRDIPPREP